VNVVANPECLFPDVDLSSLGGTRSFPPCRQSGAWSARSRDLIVPEGEPVLGRLPEVEFLPLCGRSAASMSNSGHLDARREGKPVGRLTRSSFSTTRPATLLTHDSSPLERYCSCAGGCRSPAPSRVYLLPLTTVPPSQKNAWKNSRTAATSANATGFTLERIRIHCFRMR